MSGLLAGKVWQSALDGELKPLAAALADIADDFGEHIYPSVAYMAWLLNRSERTVQTALKELRAAGVLKVVREGGRGAGRTTEYRLVEKNFPGRPTWRDQRTSGKGAESASLPTKGAVYDKEGCSLGQGRVKPTAPNPSRNVIEQPCGPPSSLPPFGRPAPQGAKLPTDIEQLSVGAETDPEEEKQPVPKGQEWLVLGLGRRGVGSDLFRKEWRLHFVNQGRNGQSLTAIAGAFLNHCARLRLAVPPAFERAAREEHGSREDHARGN